MNRQHPNSANSKNPRGTRSVTWLLIASLLGSTLTSVHATASASPLSDCESTIYWSKRSPNDSLIVKEEGDKVYFLKCSLKMVKNHDKSGKPTAKRTFDGCKPLEKDHPYYTKEELNEEWWTLVKEVAKHRSTQLFVNLLVTIVGTRVAQGIASAVGRAGVWAMDAARKVGPSAYRATDGALKALGAGENLAEGSEVVAHDRNLRFFPAYIGMGGGLIGDVSNDMVEAKTNNGFAEVLAISPTRRTRLGTSDFLGKACAPVELEEFARMSVNEYADLIQSGLNHAREHMDPRAISSNSGPKSLDQMAEEKALEEAPTGGPAASTRAK